MPLTPPQIDARECVRKQEADMIQAFTRVAHLTKRSFDDFWHQGTDNAVLHAEAVNAEQAARGETAAGKFLDHAAIVQACVSIAPDTASMFENPPIDTDLIFDANGMIDTAALRSALDALIAE